MEDQNDIDEMVLTDDDKEALATAFLAETILYSGSQYVDNSGNA